MTWMYGFGSSPAYVYTPPASPPPISYDFYIPPSYDLYTPPSYDFSPPPTYYTPPTYVYEPPAYTPPVYEPPVYTPFVYTPPVYDLYTPPSYDTFYSTPSSPVMDWTYGYTNPALVGYKDPNPASWETWHQNSPMSQYLIDSSKVDYSDPFGPAYEPAYNKMMGSYTTAVDDVYDRLGKSYAALSGYGVDVGSGSDSGSNTNYGGSYADTYGALSGSSYNIPDSSSTAYDFGPSVDYGSSYNTPEINYGSPETNYNIPESATTRGVQVASIDPNNFAPNVANDYFRAPEYLADATPTSAKTSSESGASSGASILPLADGSAVVTRADGSTATLDPEQTSKLLSGDNSVLLAQADDNSTTAKFGAKTLISKDDLSLDSPEPKRPAFNPATMEGTREQYEARSAAEMARARAGVTPETLADRLEAYSADNQNYSVTPEDQLSYDAAMKDIMEKRGGFSSQWQTSGSDRIMINDDGTGIGINTETGETYALTARQVGQMIDNKQLNTKESGYVGATGGTGNRPGGSPPQSSGLRSLLDKALGNIKASGGSGVSGGGGGGGGQQKGSGSGMNPALLGLLAALAARGEDSGAGAGAVMPAYGLDRTKAGLDKGRRAGSEAQRYYTGPGIVKKAEGGITALPTSPLGGYSDGGRLLRGPGDGVSDSIPATIGNKQPARLADGEFVVPARIVSELGNGSTEAGARKLYSMMERVQEARRKTVGKGKVAHNSRADKYLPK